MAYPFTLTDVAFLCSAEGERALAECAMLPLTDSSRLADVAAARRLVGANSSAVLETVLLRRKALSKLDDPSGWLFTGEALEQASPSLVARHRAQRLVGLDVHDVTARSARIWLSWPGWPAAALVRTPTTCGWPWRGTTAQPRRWPGRTPCAR